MTETMREAVRTGTRPPVRVVISDDDPDSRMLLRIWLGQRGSFEVVGEAADGAQAVAVATRLRPDVVVLDFAMPGLDGFGAATELRRALPDVRLVVHSAFSAHRMARVAIDAGADVYVEKAVHGDGLIDVLEGLFSEEDAADDPHVDARPELAQLALTTELLEAAVISSPVGALLLDASGRLVIANPVADRLLGGTSLLGLDHPVRTLFWADTGGPVRDEDLPLLDACAGTPFDNLALSVRDEEGPSRGTFLKLSGRPVAGPDGEPTGAVISVLDDTAVREAQRELAATHEELRRSNAELADFASTASHDLNQPLMKIHGYAQMLQELDLGDERARDFVDRIAAASERMRAFIRDLLSFSQVTSGGRAFEPVALSPLVDGVVELFEQEIAEKGASVERDALPTVVADPTQMEHLLQNLVGNALTYVADGVAPVIRISSGRDDRAWRITVSDNGIGIGADDRERAFAMFERLVPAEEYPGTGIGLALCAKIVERHGGRIWIEGEPGRGTTICFTVPDQTSA